MDALNRALAAVVLTLALMMLLGGLAVFLAQVLWQLYPQDTQDCPSGSERWGRMIQGHMQYACFQLHDAKGS